jgi:ubiquinone/menaquinone biosynthesis C-methylase UbiE
LVRRSVAVALIAASLGAAVAAHRWRGGSLGHEVSGGILVGNATVYDRMSGVFLGSLFDSIADDVASHAPPGAKVLEVGCGPGHLSMRLATRRGIEVTGLDLDPTMVARARSRAAAASHGSRSPRFVVGDVADLPFDVATFDLVVSTFSLHHWSDPGGGIKEIARVLNTGGRALIWDLGPGNQLFHADLPDPVTTLQTSRMRIVDARPWRWPWRFSVSQRVELTRD